MHRLLIKSVVFPLLLAFFVVGALAPTARAAVVDTQTLLRVETGATQAELQALLARGDVREQLVALGVDPDDASIRIAALTDAELRQLHQHIDDLPAGSSALAVLGAVFLVLLVLELVGVTNVFSRL